MNNPFFSVVITCYNYEKYIGHCIQSVLNQDFTDFEIIIVNAGSTDGSQQVINSFKNVIKANSPKGSHAVACNYGFKKCKGSWVLFLDADDFLFRNCLINVYGKALNGFVKVQYNLKICDPNGFYGRREFTSFPLSYNSEIIQASFEKTGTYLWPVTSGNVYLSRFLKLVFPLKANLPPDGQLNTMAPAFGRIYHINRALGCYRLHGQNMDNRSLQPWDTKRFQYNLKRRYKEFYYANKLSRQLKKRFPLKYSINFELTFITYRILLKKLGASYFMDQKDTILFLLYLYFSALLRNFVSNGYLFRHFFWIFCFLLAPRQLSFLLVKKRYSRVSNSLF